MLINIPDVLKVGNLKGDRKSYWLYTNHPFDNRKREEAFDANCFEKGLEVLARVLGLSDILYLSFVFIYILALFPRFCDRQVEESRSEESAAAFRPVARGCAVGVWSGTVRISDILYLSFVFINILALFPRFWKA